MNEKAKAKIDIIKLGFKRINHIAISDDDIEKLPLKELERYFDAGMKAVSAGDKNKYPKSKIRYGRRNSRHNRVGRIIGYLCVTLYFWVVLYILITNIFFLGWLYHLLFLSLLIHELYFIFSNRACLMDLIMQTTTGRVFFWILLIVAIGLTLYIPQVWGEWTRSGIING
jgi:hypothetical protein